MLDPSFPMAYRFTDKGYAVWPSRDLEEIRILTAAEAAETWTRCVHPSAEHLLRVVAIERLGFETRTFDLDGDRAEKGREVLRRAITAPPSELVVSLWGPLIGLRVPWEVFLRHWEDFWYPSDDNSVVIVPSSAARLEFVDERVSLVEMVGSTVKRGEIDPDWPGWETNVHLDVE